MTKFLNVQNHDVVLPKIPYLFNSKRISNAAWHFVCRYEQEISVWNFALKLRVVAQQMASNFSWYYFSCTLDRQGKGTCKVIKQAAHKTGQTIQVFKHIVSLPVGITDLQLSTALKECQASGCYEDPREALSRRSRISLDHRLNVF